MSSVANISHGKSTHAYTTSIYDPSFQGPQRSTLPYYLLAFTQTYLLPPDLPFVLAFGLDGLGPIGALSLGFRCRDVSAVFFVHFKSRETHCDSSYMHECAELYSGFSFQSGRILRRASGMTRFLTARFLYLAP